MHFLIDFFSLWLLLIMIKLSVVIITYNEDRNIDRCLKSVMDIADEIVVVDSHSTDNTKQICKKYGVRFFEHKFEGYIRQKNYAADQATFPHQLSLDADEALSDELKNEIKMIKANWNCDGYRMNRLANYCGKWIRHCGWYPDTKLRLYDSTKGRWQGVYIHEKFEMIPGSTVGFLHGDILHYTYYTVDEHLRQADKFSTLAARELRTLGKPVYFFMVISNPVAKFIRNYLFHLGFLDGYYGFRICWISAGETFKKYSKALQLKHSEGKKPF
jgi:glycosyltransferase involved in cell wall biosynthesis